MSNALDIRNRYTPQLVVPCPDDAADIWVELRAGDTEFAVQGAVLDEHAERSVPGFGSPPGTGLTSS